MHTPNAFAHAHAWPHVQTTARAQSRARTDDAYMRFCAMDRRSTRYLKFDKTFFASTPSPTAAPVGTTEPSVNNVGAAASNVTNVGAAASNVTNVGAAASNVTNVGAAASTSAKRMQGVLCAAFCPLHVARCSLHAARRLLCASRRRRLHLGCRWEQRVPRQLDAHQRAGRMPVRRARRRQGVAWLVGKPVLPEGLRVLHHP
jgi:hypothetical protein